MQPEAWTQQQYPTVSVVDDVDALYAAWRAGVAVAEAPETAPWQARKMLVVDPEGNRLRFEGPVPG